jgi:hypothetical protein
MIDRTEPAAHRETTELDVAEVYDEEEAIKRGRAFLADRATKRLDDLERQLTIAFAYDPGTHWQGVSRIPSYCTDTAGWFDVISPEGTRIEMSMSLNVHAAEVTAQAAVEAATRARACGHLATVSGVLAADMASWDAACARNAARAQGERN